jgi:putative membrane-bound dehydrogenase-like protein
MSPAAAKFKTAKVLSALAIVFLAMVRNEAAPSSESRPPQPPFFAAPGLEASVWAETPMLFNPTSIDVDVRGRVWVAEAVNYRAFREPEAHRGQHLRRPEGDRIVILEDSNGDGYADSSKVFVQDPDLVAPLGIAVIGNRVIVSCSPHLIIYTDETGNDQPDKKEIFLTGFGGFDHDHGLHSLTAGPDGRWYFNVGNAGPHLVTDRSNWTLRSGSSYNGGSPYNTNNVPGLKSDDGRIWTGGLALRINPDGTGLTVLAHNFRNAYEVALDSFGNLWQSDNDDEVQSCRTTWLMEGGNMGFFSADGARSWRADRRPGQSIPTAHWRQDDPGVLPAGDIYGAGAPTGVVVYEGDLLPARFHGMILNADAGRNLVFGHIPHPRGAGFKLERAIFLSSRKESTEDYVWDEISRDERTWFRPSDVAVGTDGAIYVSDWYDPIVGGHAMQDRKGQGRILRIIPEGWKVTAPVIDLNTLEGQLAALASPAVNVRASGWERLKARGPDALPSLTEMFEDSKPVLRARALWLIAQIDEGRELLFKALQDENPRIRVTAFRAIRQLDLEVLEQAALLARDPSPAVRREAAIALRDYSFEQTRDILLSLAARYDGEDRWYLEAFGIACDGKQEEIYPLLLARFGQPDPLKWSDAFAHLVWRLHPKAAVDDLLTRARSTTLASRARHRAIDTLAFIPDPAAAAAMVQLAAHEEEAIKAAAGWWTQLRAANEWKDFPAVKNFQTPAVSQINSEQAKLAFMRATLLNPELSLELRSKTGAQLAGSKEGGLLLIQLASQQRLPPELLDALAEHIYLSPDLGVRALASQYFPKKANSGEPFPSIAELLQMPGDSGRGREIFFGPAGSCFQCHQFAGLGRELGPDLTDTAVKFNRETLLDAILNPSASIAFGYEPWLITTRNGETFSGFILGDGEMVILRDISGEQRSIPSSQITRREKQKVSLMPDNLGLGLQPQQLADLVEFLLLPAPFEAQSNSSDP